MLMYKPGLCAVMPFSAHLLYLGEKSFFLTLTSTAHLHSLLKGAPVSCLNFNFLNFMLCNSVLVVKETSKHFFFQSLSKILYMLVS
jgi:hypothetical protein